MSRASLHRLAAALAVVPALAASVTRADVQRFRSGGPSDATPRLFGPAYLLGGGEADVDAAHQWLVDAVRGCAAPCAAALDVVVLRAAGADGYNDYFLGMDGVASVETLVVGSRRDAEDAGVAGAVRRAEVVFFAGGDPCDYVRYYKGTAVEAAVRSVAARGGGVGGTSAGLAIQGGVTYDACGGSIPSPDALADPYDRRVRFTEGPFAWSFAQGTVMDSHFVARDRMGRALVFAARQVEDGRAARALAVAVDENAALVVDGKGRATVMGSGPAYFVLADHAPEVCRPGAPLTYSGFQVWKRAPGESFDLARRPERGDYTVDVIGGVINRDPY